MKIIKRAAALALVIITLLSTVAFADVAVPEINAESAVLINADTGRVLYEKNSHQRMYPASMTKMLTAMVVLDNMDTNETIIVDNSITQIPWDSSVAGLEVGEVLTVENLIRGLIIPSGNDVAAAAASAVTKKALGDDISYDEAEEYFTGLMNEKAKTLGCTESNFANPHGYHDDNHYTTASDMSLIAQAAMKYDLVNEVAGEIKFSGNSAGKQKYNVEGKTVEHTWYSHNSLITSGDYFYSYATGIKTGFTDQAGDCLAASATKEDENLIAIIMNSEDPGRWNDARSLFEWAFENYDMVVYRQIGVAATAKLTGQNRLKGDTIDISINENMSEYLSVDEIAAIQSVIVNDAGGETIEAPVEQGERVATIQFLLDGNVIGSTDAYATRAVGKANIFNTSAYYIKTFLGKVFTAENIKYIAAAIAVIIVIVILLIAKNRRKHRYRIKGNYSNKNKYDTSRINSKKRRKRGDRDRYNKYR